MADESDEFLEEILDDLDEDSEALQSEIGYEGSDWAKELLARPEYDYSKATGIRAVRQPPAPKPPKPPKPPAKPSAEAQRLFDSGKWEQTPSGTRKVTPPPEPAQEAPQGPPQLDEVAQAESPADMDPFQLLDTTTSGRAPIDVPRAEALHATDKWEKTESGTRKVEPEPDAPMDPLSGKGEDLLAGDKWSRSKERGVFKTGTEPPPEMVFSPPPPPGPGPVTEDEILAAQMPPKTEPEKVASLTPPPGPLTGTKEDILAAQAEEEPAPPPGTPPPVAHQTPGGPKGHFLDPPLNPEQGAPGGGDDQGKVVEKLDKMIEILEGIAEKISNQPSTFS